MNTQMAVSTFPDMKETDDAFRAALIPTDVILDIGCGIRPFSLFVPKVHLAVEPWKQYHPLLQRRYATVPGFVLLSLYAPDDFAVIPDKSVDSVFMLDVIEHLEKAQGTVLIAEAERIARRQIAVFTPLGYMEQSYEESEKDSWGFDNTELQTHKSGWCPEDFGSDWLFYVCETYHTHPKTQEVHGAFYAIKNLSAGPETTIQDSNAI